MPGFDAIVAVNEVDRSRRSTEIDALAALLHERPGGVLAVPATTLLPDGPHLRRALSLPNDSHPCRVVGFYAHSHLYSAAIPEEDELRPSPCRTSITSPLTSTTNLPATRIAHGVQQKLVPCIRSSSDHVPDMSALQTPVPLSPSHLRYEKMPPSYFFMSYRPPPVHAIAILATPRRLRPALLPASSMPAQQASGCHLHRGPCPV
ncbi:hypothetical protein BC628DRAFT_868443 [Trametes gibbosa]|nr:hypothetical protein BC628DRAFT_868443 [Trametes gibbosa]